MPDGPIIRLPDVPWSRSPSVFDSSLTKAMRMITEVLGPDPESQIVGLVGTIDIPGASGPLGRAIQGLARRAGLYSRVEQVAAQVPAKGVHPNRLRSMLQSGASQEEAQYRRIPELLASHGERPVTGEALGQHLAANPAPFPEVVTKGGPVPPSPLKVTHDLDAMGQFQIRETETGRIVGIANTAEQAAQYMDEFARAAGEDPRWKETPTKFSQYQLPGGEHYREQLLTLPTSGSGGKRVRVYTSDGMSAVQVMDDAAIEKMRASGRRRFEVLDEVAPKGTFQGSHWDEPNVLVHVRHNERTLPTGERGRFLEEVQSDWHQQGKRKGYQSEAQKAPSPVAHADLSVTSGEHSWTVRTSDGRSVEVGRGTVENEAEARSYAKTYFNNRVAERERELAVRNSALVPDAPFKESWPDLALKQQLMEVVDDPKAEWIGFTSGKTQADRYNLRKHVSRITYDPDTKNLIGFGHEGGAGQAAGAVIDQTVEPDKLADVIGKEAAERLLQAPRQDKRFLGNVSRVHVLEGVGLDVGGEGMRKFYDELLPKRLEKLVKPFGGRVEQAPVMRQPGKPTDFVDFDAWQRAVKADPDQSQATAWIVRLTPEMKAKIKAAGLPLAAVPMALASEGEAGAQPTRPQPVASHQTPPRPVASHLTEPEFQRQYSEIAARTGLDPNPEGQHYDYRAALAAGARPDASGHWPSQYKDAQHPNRVVGGFDTVTGQRVPGTPQATERELVALGWDPAFARRVSR